jgi:hypothetical protein
MQRRKSGRKKKTRPRAWLREAASELERTRKRRQGARDVIAQRTKPGDHGLIVSSRYSWAQKLHESKAKSLHEHGGVAGSGLGFRVSGGVRDQTPSLTVFVREKLPAEVLQERGISALARGYKRGSRRLPVDVVALGQLHRQARPGDSIGALDPASKGTLGGIAIDAGTGALCGLTAMHVTGLQEFPVDGTAAPQFTSPSPLDAPGAPDFGRLRRGTSVGVDAAAIDLAVAAVNEIPFLGPVAGWRPTTYPGDEGAAVWMFGATSGLQAGVIEYPHVDMPGDALGEVILVRIHSEAGDSGALLVDNNRLALGLLIGAYDNGLRAFSSIALVQALLECALA